VVDFRDPTTPDRKDQQRPTCLGIQRTDMQPVVTVDPGTVIDIYNNWDCFTGQVQSETDTLEKLDLSRINSATGPIAVKNAMPGDSISVTLIDIKPGPQGAGMEIPEWGQLIEHAKSPTTRIFKVEGDTITMQSNGYLSQASNVWRNWSSTSFRLNPNLCRRSSRRKYG
jgi:amidase